MLAVKEFCGEGAEGPAFTVCAPVLFEEGGGKRDACRNWSFAVESGDELSYSWPAKAFEHGRYHLRLHGPNCFYREFKGNKKDPALDIRCDYAKHKKAGANMAIKLTSCPAPTTDIKENYN